MNRTAILLVSLVLVASSAVAVAPQAEGKAVRIFVHSDSQDLRHEVGVRHDFGAFFSSVVPEHKLRELQERGVATELVPTREILCHGGPPPHNGCGGGGSRATPSDQTPYGIQQIYNNDAISSTSGGNGIRLGHLDTGIDQAHLDLVNRIAKCVSTAGGSCADKNGHGTHTAGTAAADAGSDGLGIYGVAPGASIYTYRVCGNGGFCFVDDTIAAIDGCIADGCNVITFSIGGNSPSEPERTKIQEFNNAGGLFIAAAGNDGPDLGSIDYPGAFKETLAIAAINSGKSVASFSSRGTNNDNNPLDEDGEVAFAAAGVSVESTWKGGGYNTISGTSMATPHVAGLALKKWNGRQGTINALVAGAEDITSGTHAGTGIDAASGYGLPHV